MYTLSFNGYFELEYPNEFLAELEELKKKHDVHFFGSPILRDLGHYVDFQSQDNVPIENVDIKKDEPSESI